MIHVSSDFKAQMEVRTDFKEQAEVTFADGTTLALTENDFTVSNNSLTDGAGSSGLPLGAAIQRQVQIELMNDDDHLESYDFVGSQIRLYMTFRLPKTKDKKERIEKIEYGYFTVIKPETYGQTVIVTAADDMYRADKKFYSDLSFPTSAQSLFVEMCEHCGIQPGNTAFPNCSMIIQEKPEGNDLTFRNVFGYLAMLASGNARISRSGTLEVLSYDFSVFDQEDAQIQTLRNFESLKFGTEDVVITGIRMKTKGKSEKEDQTFLCGQEGYLLEVENPLAAGWEQQLVDSIGKTLVGVHLRDFSGDHVAYPLAEFMDPVYIEDRKGRTYPSVLTDIDFSFCGMTTFKNSAVSAIRNSSKFSSSAEKTYEEIRKITAEERSAREIAIENLARRLETSSGLYCTKDEQPDGSIIYYMHDKAELEDSIIIWKLTAEAIGISTDGGKTYPYGLDVSGTAILKRVYTIGLNASYINSGTFTAKDADGNIVFLVDVDTGRVQIDASSITMHSESMETYINGVKQMAEKAVTDSIVQYYLSDSADVMIGGKWSNTAPAWTEGKYMWSRTQLTYGNGTISITEPTCISGATGQPGKNGEDGKDGADAVMLLIESSNGTVFKNSDIATTFTVSIIMGDLLIGSYRELTETFGSGAALQWSVKRVGEIRFTPIPADDARLSDHGFLLTLQASDIDQRAVFNCELSY